MLRGYSRECSSGFGKMEIEENRCFPRLKARSDYMVDAKSTVSTSDNQDHA